MVYAVIAILTVALHIHLICTQTVDVRCTVQFCKDKINQTPCQELPAGCRDSSGTMSGIMMPEPSTCNCCDYCIPYLKEGDDCVVDGQGQPLYKAVCGPGLRCFKKDDSATCVPLDTNCTKEQRDYDEAWEKGTLGFTQVRTLCDEKGDYLSPHCIGASICYCVNSEGERIFGEKVFSSPGVQMTMTCECSLAAWRAEKLAKEMEIYSQPIHCLEDGSYDPLQCDDSNWCRCLQAGSNIPGPDRAHEIEIKDKLKCFDPNIHQDGKYARKCEVEALKIKQTVENLLSEDIIPVGLRLPACQYDGRYSRVMINDTWKVCVDPDGNTIDSYEVLRNDPLSDGMDCNCARTSFLLKRAGQTELPTCCCNGNFREMQCRRGFCYCVDRNGNQQGKELEEAMKNELPCSDPCSNCMKPE